MSDTHIFTYIFKRTHNMNADIQLFDIPSFLISVSEMG